jgi:hypothetical protein
MNRLTALLVVLLLNPGESLDGRETSQTAPGIKGGLNVADMSVDTWGGRNMRAGFHAGVFLKIPVKQSFFLQPEILYSQKGANVLYDQERSGVEVTAGEIRFSLNYIEMPVFMVYQIYNGLNLHLGPYAGYLLNTDIRVLRMTPGLSNIYDENEIGRENFNNIDYGLSAGFGLDFGSYQFGIKYNLGLTRVTRENDISETLLGDAGNMVTYVFIALRF